jgi:hypothetical protein
MVPRKGKTMEKVNNICKWVVIFVMLWMLNGCRTIASGGDMLSSFGQDVRSIAEGGEDLVRSYSDGL